MSYLFASQLKRYRQRTQKTKAWVNLWVLASLGIALALPAAPVTSAATCPFDTGGSDAINDGVVLTRYALGITGAPLTASTRYASLDPLQVKANIECVGCALDMNGDNQIDAVDATIIARHLAGFSGASVTNGLALGSGSRSTTAAVTSFLANGCAASTTFNAFVQGGNAFGAPAVLGTTDGQPLIVGTGGGSGLRIAISPGTNTVGAISIANGSANNLAPSFGSTVAGGGYLGNDCYDHTSKTNTRACGNVASGDLSTVSGGVSNIAYGPYASVSGGAGNSAITYFGSVLGGQGNTASGFGSTVAGGINNVASGSGSFAAGYHAEADKDGAFVWADKSTTTPFKVSTTWASPYGVNTFSVRATGGVLFATSVIANTGAPENYCLMRNGISGWYCTSDRNVKERIVPITPSRVLAGVLAMPVSTWSIIGSKFRQMGPMAQDFYRAFGLGDSDKAINSIDASGVAFAAIQGLNETVNQKLRLQQRLMRAKDQEIATLKSRLAAIEKRLGF